MIQKILRLMCLVLLLGQVTSAPWDDDHGHNEPFVPTPGHSTPGKKAFNFDDKKYFYEYHKHNEKNGTYKRSPCPALNTLANRGFLARSGKSLTYPQIAQAARDVWNFGDDNIQTVLFLAFNAHPNATTLDLDQFGDATVQHIVNFPAAPTRQDIGIGDNINLNPQHFAALLASSKDGQTLSLEDLAEHHHLRHNQSKADNPKFRSGNFDTSVTIVQYAILASVIGRNGPSGPYTLYLDDVRTFFQKEDFPSAYQRREAPLYFPEATVLTDRLTHHIGFQIERPFPKGDGFGKYSDVEPVKAKFDNAAGGGVVGQPGIVETS